MCFKEEGGHVTKVSQYVFEMSIFVCAPQLKNSWQTILWLKSSVFNLWVEKSGVKMSCNPTKSLSANLRFTSVYLPVALIGRYENSFLIAALHMICQSMVSTEKASQKNFLYSREKPQKKHNFCFPQNPASFNPMSSASYQPICLR